MNSECSRYFVHHTAEVESRVIIGDGAKIWNHAQLRAGCTVGMNTNISKNVFIDQDCAVGANVKIQNNVSVYRGVVIEDDVFVGPSAVFTNDLYPRANNLKWEIVNTYIRKGASIGAGAVIVCGCEIGRYSMIGAGALVCNDIDENQLVVGNPAKLVGHVYKSGKRIQKTEINADTLIATCAESGESVKIKAKDMYIYT